MAKIKCEVSSGTEENENGYEVDCIRVRCSKCGHEEMSYGDGDNSVKRCFALLNENCPEGENNFYVGE